MRRNLRFYDNGDARLVVFTPMVFYDNRDNGNNRKNGRNGLCHEVTYNKDNKITVVNLFIFRKTKEITSVC